MTTEETCPGVGRCHGPISWCPDCDVTSTGPCDMRARGERCDVHQGSAVLRPLLEEARHEAACLDHDTADALVRARSADRAAARLREEANRLELQLVRTQTRADEIQAELTAALRDEEGPR